MIDPGDQIVPRYTSTDPAQGGLFEAHARTEDPETSHEAAASITSEKLTASRAAVLDCFRRYGKFGLSDQMLAWCYNEKAGHGWPQQSPSGLRTRRKELVESGHLEDTGRKTQTPGGRAAIVWGLT